MRKILTTFLIIFGLICSAAAEDSSLGNLTPDSVEITTQDTLLPPSVVGADSIDPAKFYLLYNQGLNLYLSLEGKGVSTPDSAAAWQFSAATGSTTIASGDHFVSMSGSLFGGWSASVGYSAANLTIRNSEGVFSFSASAFLAGTRYLGLNANGVLAANQDNAGDRNRWLLVEVEAPIIEDEPTNGYRIISVSGSSNRVDYVIAYPSIRPDGTEVELSGAVMVPVRNGAFNADHFFLSSHYTMTKNSEVPSSTNPMEAMLYTLGGRPVMVAPDYLGYGISKDEIHPYVAPDIMARNCVDMLLASYHLLEEKYGVIADSLHLPTYGVGYSQGGSIALAIQRFIENDPYLTDAQRLTINYSGSNCGAGPYDPLATLSQYIYQDSLSMPVAAPLLVIGLVSSHSDLMNGHVAEDYFSDAFNAAHLIDSINSRNYTTSDLNRMIINACGGGTMHVMLSDSALDLNSELMQPFMKTLGMSNLTRDWTPQAPIHFFHNTGDDVVPFLNTMSAYRGLFGIAEGGLSLAMTGSPQGHTEAAVSFMLPLASGGYKSYRALDSIPSYPIPVKESGREGIAFWWHAVQVEASEGGHIYATGDWRMPLGEEDYADTLLVKWVVAGQNGKSSFRAWAEAEEGYSFAGWYQGDTLLSSELEEVQLWNMAATSANEDGIVNGTSYYPTILLDSANQVVAATPAILPDRTIRAVFVPVLEPGGDMPTILDEATLSPIDDRMFDLLGRPIQSPVAGQVYIVNGRKFIRR